MKKLFASILTIAMLVSCSLTAFAVDVTGDKKQDIDVKADYNGTEETVRKVSVNVQWDAMKFTYSEKVSNVWSEKDHSYSTEVEDMAWTAEGNTITVTNHSNLSVSVDFDYAAEADYGAVTGKFAYNKDTEKDGTILLNSGENTTFANADAVTATLTLEGRLTKSAGTNAQVGKVSVVIRKVED